MAISFMFDGCNIQNIQLTKTLNQQQIIYIECTQCSIPLNKQRYRSELITIFFFVLKRKKKNGKKKLRLRLACLWTSWHSTLMLYICLVFYFFMHFLFNLSFDQKKWMLHSTIKRFRDNRCAHIYLIDCITSDKRH